MKQSPSLYSVIRRKSCRVCDNECLEDVLSLGIQYMINFLDSTSEQNTGAPLDLVLCNEKKGGCGLLQLRHTVSADSMYRQFWYKSGVNKTMIDALNDIVMSAEKLVRLHPKDIVLDIGANDGTLLRCYTDKNLMLIGFEPATNLVEDAKIRTTKIINDFFTYEKYQEEMGNEKAKIITSIAMFYDLEDPNKFVSDIVKTLDENGIWIIQMNYLGSMLENNAFDNIVHEHLEYYSLRSLETLLNKHNLSVFDIALNDINGGSIRTYIKHKNCKKYITTKKVEEIRNYEHKLGLGASEVYHQFAKRINELKKKTYDFIQSEVKNGKKVYAYGASTRGNTLLQFYNLDNKLITAIADRNPIKWGKKTIGTGIPIISEAQARDEKPNYFLILPWYFIQEFKQREKKFLESGGKFILPLPNFEIVDSHKHMEKNDV